MFHLCVSCAIYETKSETQQFSVRPGCVSDMQSLLALTHTFIHQVTADIKVKENKKYLTIVRN